MNILPAAQPDVPQLIDLWREAFGEEKEAVLPFFREIVPLCRPFCVKDGDTICAMAYALSVKTFRSRNFFALFIYFTKIFIHKNFRIYIIFSTRGESKIKGYFLSICYLSVYNFRGQIDFLCTTFFSGFRNNYLL